MTRKETVEVRFKNLQERICNALEQLDGKGKFHEDLWTRATGGGGRTRVITGGAVLEKGGVNFSAVHGDLPPKISEALKVQASQFFATGVSIVIHPVNPWVPIIHMNVRYFETGDGETDSGSWWFGGGIDLTPHYIDPADGVYLHQQLKQVCNKTDDSYYPRFKQWADDYFYLKHRNETRGVGGIFFDRLTSKAESKSFAELWEFVQNVGDSFVPIYAHFVGKYKDRPWNKQHLRWQKLRRSRYAEFNLLWDKGTKFGLDTNGRTESILMSMPPNAIWEYDMIPKKGSPEAETLKWLRKDIDWINHV